MKKRANVKISEMKDTVQDLRQKDATKTDQLEQYASTIRAQQDKLNDLEKQIAARDAAIADYKS